MAENSTADIDPTKNGIKPYRVLSIDGGGIRGLYTACVLKSLMNRYSNGSTPLDIGKGFDLLVGTSTGGIIATALAKGIPIQRLVDLYQKEGPKIFKDPTPDGGWGLFKWSCRNLFKSANQNEHLKGLLVDFFGNETVKDIWDTRGIGLCLTSVDLSRHTARVFKTPHFKNKNADNGRKLADICLASSAAPIILPIAKHHDPDNSERLESFVDGGLWANNPILIGLVEALENSHENQPIEIISIGTCAPVAGNIIDDSTAEVGLAYWKAGISPLSASMDAQAHGHFHTANFLARCLSKLGKKVTVQRLHQDAPSENQAKHLGLDKVHPQSIQTLMDLASTDARLINGKINNGDENYHIVDSIFKSMPMLESEEV